MNLLGWLFYAQAVDAFDRDDESAPTWLEELEAATVGTTLAVVALLFLWAYGREK